MTITGITWRSEGIDDEELLHRLPSDLTRILHDINGFILHNGALHVRGASVNPECHALRAALEGPTAFHHLYEKVEMTDVPFAQDQVGDQFLLRDNQVWRLSAESGDIELLSTSLDDFFRSVNEDIKALLNVGLEHTMQPGQLLMAYPPFIVRTSDSRVSLKPVSATEVIGFHAELARQIQNAPDGTSIEFKIGD